MINDVLILIFLSKKLNLNEGLSFSSLYQGLSCFSLYCGYRLIGLALSVSIYCKKTIINSILRLVLHWTKSKPFEFIWTRSQNNKFENSTMATVPLKFPIVRITIGLKLQDNKIAAIRIMVTITFKIVIASVTITNKFCITNNKSLMKNIKIPGSILTHFTSRGLY